MKKTTKKFVVVTTEHRGVFAGQLVSYDSDKRCATISDARMCVHWTQSIRGVVGLAKTGPNSNCRITPAAPQMIVEKITAIFDCTDDAKAAWEKEPWA